MLIHNTSLMIIAAIVLVFGLVGGILGKRRNLPGLILLTGGGLLAASYFSRQINGVHPPEDATPYVLYFLLLAASAGIALGGLIGWVVAARTPRK